MSRLPGAVPSAVITRSFQHVARTLFAPQAQPDGDTHPAGTSPVGGLRSRGCGLAAKASAALTVLVTARITNSAGYRRRRQPMLRRWWGRARWRR
jgi:hypothetical protein